MKVTTNETHNNDIVVEILQSSAHNNIAVIVIYITESIVPLEFYTSNWRHNILWHAHVTKFIASTFVIYFGTA